MIGLDFDHMGNKVVKILLVEFPRWESRSIRESLSEEKRDFLDVEDIEAPIKIIAYEPDLILAGVSGPSLDEILDAREELDKECPVIFVSNDKTTIRRALIKGANDYLLRPFETFEIHHRCDRFLPKPEKKEIPEGIELGPAPMYERKPGHMSLGELAPGRIYLIREPKPKKGLKMFRNELEDGMTGLSLSRQNPKHLRKYLEELNVNLIWLTANMDPGEKCIEAKDVTKITRSMDTFLKEHESGLIYLDGLEYLVSQTDFGSILRLLQFVNDKIMVSDDRLLISLDPRAFSMQQMSLIERECVILQ